MVLTVIGLTVLATPPASANASGCSYRSTPFSVTVFGVSVSIPDTGVCVNVLGSGLRGDRFTGYFQIRACNFQIRLERWDSAGVKRLVNNGPQVNGCHTDVSNHKYTITNVGFYNGGRACAALYMAGILRERACVDTFS